MTDTQRRRNLLARLRAALPERCVLTDEEDTRPYECDGLTLFRQLPLAVALPENEAQAIGVLKICHELNVPVVPRGAGTGLSGSALPHAEGVLLSLAKLNRIVKVDPLARTATVQPGVANLAISAAAAPHGLYYAPDPSSQIACSIGGNVAENSGGVHCLKYGLTLHNVLRVRGLTIAGDVVEFGGASLDTPGLDLLALVIGSEGMLAVTTEVTVRLVPKPQTACCIMASFADVEDAGAAVAAIIGAGIIPAGLEMLDQAATRLVEPFAHAGYDLDAAAILLCESDGTTEEVAEEIAHMSEVLRAANATRLQVSANEAERQRFWAGRKNAFPAAGRAWPAYYCTDGTIPRKHLGTMLKSIQEMEQQFGLHCPNVFHAGDGNLHPLILFDDGDPDSVARAEAFGAAILEASVRLGGTITGEHGVGVEKIDQMCSQFDRSTLDAFTAVKRAFDPPGLLNPGKVIPTLHRCAEYGRMRVRAGEQKFPELPALLMQDPLSLLAERVRAASAAGTALRIRAGGSKDFYGNATTGEVLDPSVLQGVVDYEPEELVITVRAGTRLAAVETLLGERGQMLAFEPPHFGPCATIGGCVAAGLAGPRRAAAGCAYGGVRDFLLGARLLDGRGQLLSFGGKVIKNVAGYDVARVLAGSLGILGVIVEVSLKVLPRPVCEATLRFEMDEGVALGKLNAWGAQPLPLSASAWSDGALTLRLSGARAAVQAASQRLGGAVLAQPDAEAFWREVREQEAAFFAGSDPLWRISLPSTAEPLGLGPAQFIEWGGALRWLRTTQPAQEIRARTQHLGGHATLFRGGDRSQGAFTALSPALTAIHQRLKAQFDPQGIFNRGRMFAGL